MPRWIAIFALLATPALAGDPLLAEKRAWKGVVTVRAVGRPPKDGRGGDEQEERVEFVLISRPPAHRERNPAVELKMRSAEGSYKLFIDLSEGEGGSALITKGRSAGELHPRIEGMIEPSTGRYRFAVRVTPSNLVALSMLSGMHEGRFRNFRAPIERASFLRKFEAEGKLAEGGRLISGRRVYEDFRAKLTRDVTVTWRIERIDPVLRGSVLDHLDRPVPGLSVLARTTNPARVKNNLAPILRIGETDEHGRFSIATFWALWKIEIRTLERDGVLYVPRKPLHWMNLTFDKAPDAEFRMDAYELRRLRDVELYQGHFRGDATAYWEYIHPRMKPEELKRALVR